MPPAVNPAELICAEDVDRCARYVWGQSLRATGVVHVAAVWQRGSIEQREPTTWTTLRINEATPQSPLDAFALHLARARADAIVTTGRILRSEPDLRHTLGGPGTLSEALADWRREGLGKPSPPVSLVLTGSGEVDFDHPLFAGPGRVVVFTGRAAAWHLESRALDYGVEIVAVDEPSPRAAVDFLRGAFGAATVSIEAGPTSARQLYEPPPLVDELMLSIYHSASLPGMVRGPRFLGPSRIKRTFTHRSEPFVAPTNEADARWQLTRWWRR